MDHSALVNYIVGWDNVPMHRWGQSQMFRSLAFYLSESARAAEDGRRRTEDRERKTEQPSGRAVEFAVRESNE